MKRLLLPLLAALALPTAVNANVRNSIRFDGKYQIVCDAFDKGFLTKDQKNELLIEAYIKYDDNFNHYLIKLITLLDNSNLSSIKLPPKS